MKQIILNKIDFNIIKSIKIDLNKILEITVKRGTTNVILKSNEKIIVIETPLDILKKIINNQN